MGLDSILEDPERLVGEPGAGLGDARPPTHRPCLARLRVFYAYSIREALTQSGQHAGNTDTS